MILQYNNLREELSEYGIVTQEDLDFAVDIFLSLIQGKITRDDEQWVENFNLDTYEDYLKILIDNGKENFSEENFENFGNFGKKSKNENFDKKYESDENDDYSNFEEKNDFYDDDEDLSFESIFEDDEEEQELIEQEEEKIFGKY